MKLLRWNPKRTTTAGGVRGGIGKTQRDECVGGDEIRPELFPINWIDPVPASVKAPITMALMETGGWLTSRPGRRIKAQGLFRSPNGRHLLPAFSRRALSRGGEARETGRPNIRAQKIEMHPPPC